MKRLFQCSLLIFILLTSMIQSGCKKKDGTGTSVETGHLVFNFSHWVDGVRLQADTVWYTNAAGNHYVVNELKYFISEVTLYNSNGTIKSIDDWKDIDYVDIGIPSTLKWDVFDPIPVGSYDSISFIFGISGDKNQSFMFVNPPEVNMMWPDVLGGGYHYMIMNGKWLDTNGLSSPFNLHLGIGQLYKSNVVVIDSIYAFVQNDFKVTLPNSAFTMLEDHTHTMEIRMNINSWFSTPHVYDFNYWGGAIMQNQPAMKMACENGFDVFTVGIQSEK